MIPSRTTITGVLKTDLTRMLRDRFLLGLSIYFVLVFIVLRFLIPALTTLLATRWQFDLTAYHPLLASHFVVQLGPWIPGIIGAFLLLESHETTITKAVLVSPTTIPGYLSILMGALFFAAIGTSAAGAAVIGLGLAPWPAMMGIIVATAPTAPLLALLLAAVAKNKVQAFAYLKLFGIAPLATTGCYFVPESWQWLAAIYPPFCASKAHWLAAASQDGWLLWLFVGGIGFSAALAILIPVFLHHARR